MWAGNTPGTQAWSVINTDNSAITTTSTVSGSLTVVNQRSFSVSNSGTINLGNFLRATAVTGSTTISSSGLNATTANASLGAFGGGPSGFSLTTGSFSNQYQLNFVSAKGGVSLGGPQSMLLTVTGVMSCPNRGPSPWPASASPPRPLLRSP